MTEQTVAIDQTTSSRLSRVYPDLSVRVIRTCVDVERITGLKPRISCGLRSFEEQEKLFSQGRDKFGNIVDRSKIVTNSRPGESIHHYGLAVDFCFHGPDPFLVNLKNGEDVWNDLGRIGKAHGLVWGGDFRLFKDRPHLELTYGLTLQEIRRLYESNGLSAVWGMCDDIRRVPRGSEWFDRLNASLS
jgi:peptidoglycan L-alanyl-D-glutamate endopeptidase CwlK